MTTFDPLPTLTAHVAVDDDHAAYVAAHRRALLTAARAEAEGMPRAARNQRHIAAALDAECLRVTGRPITEEAL